MSNRGDLVIGHVVFYSLHRNGDNAGKMCRTTDLGISASKKGRVSYIPRLARHSGPFIWDRIVEQLPSVDVYYKDVLRIYKPE